MKTIEGKVQGAPPHSRPRVFAVAEGKVLAEIRTDGEHNYRLELDQAPEAIGVQLDDVGMAALIAAPSATDLLVPARVRVSIRVDNSAPNAMFWLDPLALRAFPQEHLWALRKNADGTIRLHVGEWPATARQFSIELQPGKYRLTAGLIAIHPGQPALELVRVTDVRSNQDLPLRAGSVELEIDAARELTVSLGAVQP